jgi:Translation initiation factor eIF3 subunit 135
LFVSHACHFLTLFLYVQMPPTPPPFESSGTVEKSGGYVAKNPHLYQLLRSELVAKSAKPLNSDTYSPFHRVLPMSERQEDELHIRELFARMMDEFVPAAAAAIDQLPDLSGPRVCDELHAMGINVRYLPAVLSSVKSQQSRRAILTEMVARACKSRINRIWRELFRSSSQQEMSSFRYREAAADFFSALLLTTESASRVEGFLEPDSPRRVLFSESVTYWAKRVPSDVDASDSLWKDLSLMFSGFADVYQRLVEIGEAPGVFSCRGSVDIPTVVARASDLCSMHINNSAMDQLQSQCSPEESDTAVDDQLFAADISIFVGVKSMALVSLGDAVSMAAHGRSSAANIGVSNRLFARSKIKFAELLGQDGDNFLAHGLYASTLVKRSMLDFVDWDVKLDLLQTACRSYRIIAMPANFENVADLFTLQTVHDQLRVVPASTRFRAHSFAAECMAEGRKLRQDLSASAELSSSTGPLEETSPLGLATTSVNLAICCVEDVIDGGDGEVTTVNVERWLERFLEDGSVWLSLDPPPIDRREMLANVRALVEAAETASPSAISGDLQGRLEEFVRQTEEQPKRRPARVKQVSASRGLSAALASRLQDRTGGDAPENT